MGYLGHLNRLMESLVQTEVPRRRSSSIGRDRVTVSPAGDEEQGRGLGLRHHVGSGVRLRMGMGGRMSRNQLLAQSRGRTTGAAMVGLVGICMVVAAMVVYLK